MLRRGFVMTLLTLVSACATNQAGWSGSGAVPFDTALSDCNHETANIAGVQERQVAVQQCMATKGWTRK